MKELGVEEVEIAVNRLLEEAERRPQKADSREQGTTAGEMTVSPEAAPDS